MIGCGEAPGVSHGGEEVADDPLGDESFARLMAKVAASSGFQCASYKQRCLRRRVAVRMRARGVHDFAAYGALLDADELERERLMDALTINVTRLFRDRGVYDALANNVVPALWRSSWPRLRVWSAGCASGEEPYSLAMLFHSHALAMREEGHLSRVRINATDIDRRSLAAARVARYAEPAFLDAPPAMRERYFSAGYPAELAGEIREMVSFERNDMLQDPPPSEPHHLIVCRNVLIYFDRDSQERLFRLFRDLLVPGGILVLGKVETLLGESRQSFAAVSSRERIFRRR